MIAAVMPAAGLGSRFAATDKELSKQFFDLLGRPTYIWALSVLCAHPMVDVVMLVLPMAALHAVGEEIKAHLSHEHLKKIRYTTGGDTRQRSVYRGLKALDKLDQKPEYVLVHDAARPFITETLITSSINAAMASGAFTLGIAVTDTIKRVLDGVVQETLDRQHIYSIQTPQGGKFQWLLDAHRKADDENLSTTDDAAILESAGHKVVIVDGSPYNIKLTKREDLRLCEALAGLLHSPDPHK